MAINELCTFIIEAPNGLDKENGIYRTLMRTRMKWEKYFSIRIVDRVLTSKYVKELVSSVRTPYLMFLKAHHYV